MRRYLLKAWDEASGLLFIRLVHSLEEGLRATINAPLASKVAWIEYRNNKYTVSDVYKLLDRSLKQVKAREKQLYYFERWD